MSRLDISSIEIRNFLSYGDYITSIDIKDRGPTLVLGAIEENPSQSNGAGKSSLLAAFLWCLFGRTINNHSPGNKVINWDSNQNCYVKIKTTDGWEIVRTRQVDNHSDLIIRDNGVDVTSSTNANAQEFLDKKFELDYDIFISSVFCGQFGEPFLALSPQRRRETIERLLGVDQINLYADLAKQELAVVEKNQAIANSKLDDLNKSQQKTLEKIEKLKILSKEFEGDRVNRLNTLEQNIKTMSVDIKQIKLPDLAALTQKWQNYNKIEFKIKDLKRDSLAQNQLKSEKSHKLRDLQEELESTKEKASRATIDIDDLTKQHKLYDLAQTKLSGQRSKLDELSFNAKQLNSDISKLDKEIKTVRSRSGSICDDCGQIISANHTDVYVASKEATRDAKSEMLNHNLVQADYISSIVKKLSQIAKPSMSLDEANSRIEMANNLTETLSKIESEMDGCKSSIELTQTKVSKNQIDIDKLQAALDNNQLMDLGDAQGIHSQYQKLQGQLDLLREKKSNAELSNNPHESSIEEHVKDLDSYEADLQSIQDQILECDTIYGHYNYIYKSYSDKRKIKKWLLAELIPYLNDRIKYYLSSFELDVELSFSSTLDVNTGKWTYDFCSGGEKMRIDLAVMFAIYDLHLMLHGQQCNIMVLDEVDSRLDRDGVESFANIINDFYRDKSRPAPDTIFIISHKQELRDLIPSQILINRSGPFSTVSQV